MIVDTVVYDTLGKLSGREICIFGTDNRGLHCLEHIRKNHPDITVKFLLSFGPTTEICGCSAYNAEQYCRWHDLSSLVVLVATDGMHKALRLFIDYEPAEVYLCSRETDALFRDGQDAGRADYKKIPFMMESSTPRIPLVITEGARDGGNMVCEIIDFMRQESSLYSYKMPHIPVSLREFSSQVRQSDLPMRMSHLGYLQWKSSMHLMQLSPSRRFLVGSRYNFFHLDIVDRTTGRVVQWHDKPVEEGLWDYVATGYFDDTEDVYYFVRWPLRDAVAGMADGSNKVHCEVGKLDLNTMNASVIAEFDFVDRIHQLTMSGDKRYMVFAPMRVLKTPVNPARLKAEDVMRKLQEWTVLDDMATLDLQTGKVTRTTIPYPIPAHFELDPLDPHVFYVSTHSLLPHQDGVLIFNPGTIHRLRIVDGVSVIEKTYTHPGFVRTTQHCPFVFRGKVLIAATNQNKLEIIDAETMTQWHIHKLADDPLYDNADFNDPAFLSKPFSLPSQADYCDSIAPSIDGEYLALRMPSRYEIFSVAEKKMTGCVEAPCRYPRSTHVNFYMRNTPRPIAEQRYAEFFAEDSLAWQEPAKERTC